MRYSFVFLLILLGCLTYPSYASYPDASFSVKQRANYYKPRLVRESRATLGLNAPIGLLAGQVHQESLFIYNASSRFANGLTQFTPSTEKWIKTVFPSLNTGHSFNPAWAIRAMVLYDNWIYKRITAADTCNRWAMTLSAYNGGLGWIKRDKKIAKNMGKDPLIWWGNVENYSARASWAFNENRGYPKKIIFTHQPKYSAWGGATICLAE